MEKTTEKEDMRSGDTQGRSGEKPELYAPPQNAHKNPPIGPTTGKALRDWRLTRDYEKFNPTAEK